MSTTTLNIIPPTTNHNNDNRNEQYTEVILNCNERTVMKTTDIDDGHTNEKDREKGEREKKEDDVKRILTMREQEEKRTRQTNKNIDSVTSFTNEQYNCPSVNDSMTNHIPSSFNSNNNYPNISLSNNRSTYSYSTHSMIRHFREYEPSYPSINRYRTSLSSSPYRKTHYLDESDEEIINDEILEIINLDHYPTLIERWGDDTKIIIKQQGEFKIEDYVEFEEIEPTINEEIIYEIIYSNNQIKSTKEIHHTRSESRNFRKIKKRRTKCKRTTQLHQINNFNNNLSGDNYQITTIDKQIPSIINSDQSPNIDIIGKYTSLQSFKSDEEKKDLSNIIKQEYQNDIEEEINESCTSDLILTNETHFSSDDQIQSTVINDEFIQVKSNKESIFDAYSHNLIPSDQIKSEKITVDKQQDSAVESFQPIIKSEELTTSTDQQSSTEFESTKTTEEQVSSDSLIELVRQIRISTDKDEAEHFSFNALTDIVRDILATSLSAVHLPSVDIKIETTKPIEQDVEKPSIDSLVEITQQIKTIPPQSVSKTEDSTVHHTHEDEKQSDSNTTVALQVPFDDIEQTSVEETTVSSDSPVTLATIHLPSAEIKTETTDIEEQKDKKLTTNLTTTVDKQSETISTPSTTIITPQEELIQKTYTTKNDLITTNPIIETAETIISDKRQPSIPLETKEDEKVVVSSDFLADIVRQIITTALPTRLSSVDHTEQVVDQSTNDFPTEMIEQTNITSIPTTNIEDNELSESSKTFPTITLEQETISEDKAEPLSSNTLTEATREIVTTPIVDDQIETILVSKDIKSSSDSLTEIVRQIFSSPIQSIPHINESISSTTDINVQTNSESSIQDNIPNQSELLTVPIVPEPPSSATKDESLHHADKKSISDTYDILQQSPEINSINQITSYSTSELTNIMNSILNFPTKILSEELTNIPQQAEMIEQSFTPRFFIPETPTPSETDFRNLYQHRYFPSITNEQTSSDFTPIDNEQLDKNTIIPDLTKIYYELQEQRHIQPVLDDAQTEHKQETLDDNFNNHVEYFDLESFSLLSNLPSREYRQVFGVPNEVVNTVDDLTYFIDQTLRSTVSDEVKPTIIDSNEKPQIIEIFDDHQSIISTDQKELHKEAILDIISNVELDFRYSSLLDRIDTLIKPLLDLPSSLFITENESIPSKIEEEKDDHYHLCEHDDIPIDHVNRINEVTNTNLITNTTDTDKQVVTSDDQFIKLKDEKSDSNEEISHATAQFQSTDTEITASLNTIEDTNDLKNQIEEIQTTESQNEKTTIISSDQLKIESNINSTQQEETSIRDKISNAKETLQLLIEHIRPTTETKEQEDITNTPEYKQTVEETTEEKDSSNVITYATSLVTSVVSNIASNLPLTTTNEDITVSSDADASDEKDVQSQVATTVDQKNSTAELTTSNVTDSEVVVSRSSEEIVTKVEDDQQQQQSSSSIGLLEIMRNLLSPALQTKATSSADSDKVPSPIVTDEAIVISKPSEEIETKQDDEQQQSSSTGVFEIMKNLLPSTFLSKSSTGTSSESIQSVVKTQQPEDIVEKLVDENNSSSAITKLISVLNDALTTVQNVLPTSTISSTDTDQQQEYATEDQKIVVSETSLQSSTTNEEERISNVKETISNLDSSDETTAALESLLNLPDKSNDDIQQLKNLDNDKEQQTFVETVKEVVDNTYEKIVPTQEQVIRIPKQHVIFNYPWYSSHYKIAATEFDRLSSTYQSSTIDHKQQDEFEKKSSCQQLQVINDDYPWYSSYYIIADAEAKIARLYQQLNLANEQPPSPTTDKFQIESHKELTTQNDELQDEQDEDKDGFHLVQRRKRIPSSTTHEKTLPSITITTTSTLSPDIDLKPVILQGHPDPSITVSPIVPQTINTTSKKKHKKKKKDKKEVFLFEAPEPTLSDINKQKIDVVQSQIVEDERQENIETSLIDQTLKHEFEQLHPILTVISDEQKPETLSTSIVSNTEELKTIDDKKNKSTSSDSSQLLLTPVTILSEDAKINAQSIEQEPSDTEPILQSSPSSINTTIKTIRTEVIAPSKEEEEEEDNEGFQLVRYRGRILSAARSENSPPPSITTSKQILSSDIDLKTPVIHEHQSLPTSKTKKNKHKKHKKEIVSSSSIDSSQVEQTPTDQETILQSHISSSSSTIEDSNVQSKSTSLPTLKTTTIRTKPFASEEEEEEKEDNEGFQVVSYRKRTTSAPRFEKTPPPLSTKTTHNQNVSRKIDLKPLVFHGRHGSASPSIPRATAITETPSNKNKQIRPKQDKKQTSLFNTPPRSASIETHIITSIGVDNNFETPKDIKQETEQLQPTSDKYQQQSKDPQRETTLDLKFKLDQSPPAEQSTKQIVKEYHMPTKSEIKTSDQQSSIEKIVPSTEFSASNTDIQKPTLIEDDDDEFQVVHYHKHIPSSTISTISKQPSFTFTVDQKSTDTYTKHDSSTSTTAPETVVADTDLIAPSIEETIDQKTSGNIHQVLDSQVVPENNSPSNSNEPTSISTINETITSQINEPVHQIDDTQNRLPSIKSITSSTIANEELSTPSNNLSSNINDLSIAEPVTGLSQPSSTDISSTTNQIEEVIMKKSDEVITKETLTSTSIEPTINTEDEQVKTTPTKKATKRRKKKRPTDNESILQKSDDNKQESDLTTALKAKATETTTTQSFHSPPNTSEILSINELKSQPITTKNESITGQITQTIPLSSSKIETTKLSTFPSSQSTHLIDETNSKLDLFLPDYIREQLSARQTSATSTTDNPNITPIIISSDNIQKKKQRPKMLERDHEAKSLLSNEFNNTTNIEKQYEQQTISIDYDDINDDDEFIIQTSQSNKDESTNISTEQTIDNILSRGFYLWLQESQALSQQKDKSSSNSGLTHTIQSIVIQPAETDDDDDDDDEHEDSWNASQAIKPTYMSDVRTEKRIHITNAYSINHPESISTPSWLIAESNDNTFQDDLGKLDSDDEEDSMNDTSKNQSSHHTDTQSSTMEKRQSDSNNNNNNNNSQQTNFTVDDVQRCLGEDFYRQIDNNNHSINFDDWAHFLEAKNPYHIGYDVSTSLECSYAHALDEDTLLSDTIPIHHSVKDKRQRYGDFSSTNHDIIVPESTTELSSSKSKPSEYFQNCRKQKSTSIQCQNDDEIFISHSKNGLSRRVRP